MSLGPHPGQVHRARELFRNTGTGDLTLPEDLTPEDQRVLAHLLHCKPCFSVLQSFLPQASLYEIVLLTSGIVRLPTADPGLLDAYENHVATCTGHCFITRWTGVQEGISQGHGEDEFFQVGATFGVWLFNLGLLGEQPARDLLGRWIDRRFKTFDLNIEQAVLRVVDQALAKFPSSSLFNRLEREYAAVSARGTPLELREAAWKILEPERETLATWDIFLPFKE